MIKMILASTEDGGIGLDNKLPFHCPEDLKYFKEQTEGEIVIMGRKTFESLPFENGLPNRTNYVLSRTLNLPDNLHKVCQLRSSLDMRRYCLDTTTVSVWIIGGKSLYEQLFHLVDEIHHTTIKGCYDCDTFIDTSMWEDDIGWCLEEIETLSEVAEVKIWRKC